MFQQFSNETGLFDPFTHLSFNLMRYLGKMGVYDKTEGEERVTSLLSKNYRVARKRNEELKKQ